MNFQNAAVLMLLLSATMLGGCFNADKKGGPNDGETATSSSSVSQTPTNGPTCLDGSTPPCQPPANVTKGSRIQLLECRTYFVLYPVDQAKVDAAFPEGYSAGGIPSTLAVDAFECTSAVVDNATVYQDVNWFAVSIAVSAPPDVAYADGSDIYYFEACMNTPDIQALFQKAGFEVCGGGVQIDVDGNSVHVQYMKDGNALYDFTGAGRGGNGSIYFPDRSRFHQATGTEHAWFDRDAEPYDPQVPGEAGVLQVNGGFISTVQLNPGPGTLAHGGVGRGDYLILFPERNP